MKQTLTLIGVTLIITTSIVGSTFLLLPRIDTYLKLKAFDDCAKATQYSFTTENDKTETTSTTGPIKDFYKTCIEDKGYTTRI